jgi:hypothetical protein
MSTPYNVRKQRHEKATSEFVSMILHLTRPRECFPVYSADRIKVQWRVWDAEDALFRQTTQNQPIARTFPEPPPEGDEYVACRQMWGCLLLAQAEYRDHSFHTSFISDAVDSVSNSPACKSHPPTCPCKVPKNPWVSHECVKLLEPLRIRHSPKCECAGWDASGRLNPCAQLGKTDGQIAWEAEMAAGARAYEEMMERARAEERLEAIYRDSKAREDKELRRRAELKLTAIAASASPNAVETATATLARAEKNLETCACDASSHRQLACVCLPRRKAEAEMARENLKSLHELLAPSSASAKQPEPSPYDYKHNVDTCACGTCHKARVDSGTSAAYTARFTSASTHPMERYVEKHAYDEKGKMPSFLDTLRQAYAKGEGAQPKGEDDFAKQIFAELGTPHDSICPHNRPFYSCMSCSH